MSNYMTLHNMLINIPGVKKAYFQPPEGTTLQYPCIVYERSRISTRYADNNPYHLTDTYTVTVMDKDPDSAIPNMVASLKGAAFDRHYKSDNVNHDVFTIHI